MYNVTVLALQNRQIELAMDIMECEGNSDALQSEYDETVVNLLNELGDEASAQDIDFMEFDNFSDKYESVVGRKPSPIIYNYRAMVDWLEENAA